MITAHTPPFTAVDADRDNDLVVEKSLTTGSSYSSMDRKKEASDGGSTAYYVLPNHASELRHLISHKGMSKARGDIFKACYRLGEKQGVDPLYDLKKMKFFIEDLIEMYERGEHL